MMDQSEETMHACKRKCCARQLYIEAVQHKAPPKKGRRDPITFFGDDLPSSGQIPHQDAILIAMDVKGITVRRVFVDTSSSVKPSKSCASKHSSS
nr:uncharacterized protein LOC109157228 [Ipomoea trifida]